MTAGLPPVPAYIGLARPTVHPLGEMRRAAAEIHAQLADVVARLEVAGSIRRRAEACKDVEIVALPRFERDRDLFDAEYGDAVDLLERRLQALLDAGTVQKRRRGPKQGTAWGPQYKAIVWWVGGTLGWVPVDLYVPRGAACWGWVLAHRTGPAAFARQLVVPRGRSTKDGRPGLLPRGHEFRDGWLRRPSGSGDTYAMRPVPLPEEEDLFRAFGLRYLRPEERT